LEARGRRLERISREEETTQSFARVLRRDEETKRILEHLLAETQEELAGLAASSRGLDGYARRTPQTGKRVDELG
jgi:hypothetical protein